MARSTTQIPTTGELEILRIFWRNGFPLTVQNVVDEIRKQRPIAYTTMATMVRIMVKKGLISLKDKRRPQTFKVNVGRGVIFQRMTKYVHQHVFSR